MNKKLVIFDGNHLAYRAYYKFSNLRTLDEVKTGVIYGMPYVAESLIRKLAPNLVVVVFDGGRSPFRTGLLPSYKKREKKLGFDAENFYFQKDVGRDIFMALGLKVAWAQHYEADDLITMISRRYAKAGYEVVIVSGDKDFNQLLSDNIFIYNTSKSLIYNKDNLVKFIGYSPDQCVDYLCLTGDSSDNIPGYPGIGEKRGMQFLGLYGSIKNYLKGNNQFGKMDNQKLRVIWKLNSKIIDLKYYYRKFLIKKNIPWLNPITEFNEIKLKKFCSTYEIGTFLKPQFIKTFKKLNHE